MNNSTIEIIPFQNKLAHYFCRLNIEWLETFFYIEDHDREVLENAGEYIIDKGGYIFFAVLNKKIVGTVALMNESQGYELSKMAVEPYVRGQGVGQQLMEHCILFAKEKKWPNLHLYSNRKLENSIHIYKKFGFTEVELESESPYERSDIKMVLDLVYNH